jgi:diaminopimelate epimerase
MQGIKFLKMHGLGNDFVIIEKENIPATLDLKPFVKQISDRRAGVGCDQFIIFKDHKTHVEMFVFNADGSEASACGNASRCLALIHAQRHNTDTVQLHVAGRVLDCQVHSDNTVSVNMGEASFDKKWMPESSKIWEIAERFKLDLREVVCVDMGNPHLVIFSNALTDADKELLGEKLEKHQLFPEGVNVNLANIIGDSVVELKVWERGTCGFTLACGSGACATFAAARKLGLVGEVAEIKFQLGSLIMSMESGVVMRGPATLVYEGIYHYG